MKPVDGNPRPPVAPASTLDLSVRPAASSAPAAQPPESVDALKTEPSSRLEPAPAPAPRPATVGNKTTNLIKASQAARTFGIVPDFLAVPQELILSVLDEAGVAFAPAWAQFVAAQGEAAALTPAATQVLEKLQAQIRQAFAQRPVANLSQWLAVHQWARIMVRGDGIEDGKESANAGASKTLANLPPHLPLISAATGDVAAAHISPRTLTQRLAAGEDIRRPPLLSVLLQVMVGEAPGTGVPISGVMHTQEMDGPTPGMTVINATFGHNEGVVNAGLVPADTAYVTADDNLHLVERVKDHRVAPPPNGAPQLVKVRNSKGMRAAPALTPMLAAALAKLGRELETHFGYPLDIEWTCVGSQLYILQARPLVMRQMPPTSYVDTSGYSDDRVLPVRVISASGAHVRHLTDAKNIIFANSLRAALQGYFKHEDKQSVQAVIVEQIAPATSHEATTLRGAGIVVVQSMARETLLGWLEAGSAVVCPQTNRIVLVEEDEEDPLSCVRDGQIDHPLPAALSHVFVPQAETREQAIGYLQALAVASPAAVEEDLAQKSVEELLTWLRDPQDVKASWALTALMQRAVSDMTPLLKDEAVRGPALRLAWALVANAEAVNRGVQSGEGGAAYLAAVKWLRTCFLQEPGNDVLAADSVASLKRERADALSLMSVTDVSPAAKPYAMSLARVELACIDPSVREDWRSFAGTVLRGNSKLSAGALSTLVHEFVEAGILSEWLRVHFAPTWQATAGTPQERATGCLITLMRAASVGDLGAVRPWSRKIGGEVAWFKAQIDSWATPETFAGMLPQLNAFVAQLGDCQRGAAGATGFLRFLTSDDPVVQGLAASRLQAAVDIVDASIKSLVGSAMYADKPRDKANHWLAMLTPFARLSGSLIRMYHQHRNGPGAYSSLAEIVGETSLADLREVIDDTEDGELEYVFYNPYLSTERLLLGVTEEPSWLYEDALLDVVFTVAHQNSLRAIALLSHERLSTLFDALPQGVQDVGRAVLRARDYQGDDTPTDIFNNIELLDVRASSRSVDMRYMMPLRSHGATIDIHVDLDKQKSIADGHFTFEMYGDTETENRFERMATYLGLAQHAFGLDFAADGEPDIGTQSVSVSWKLGGDKSDAAHLLRITQALATAVEISFMFSNSSEFLGTHKRFNGAVALREVMGKFDQTADFDALPEAFFTDYPYLNGELLPFITDVEKRQRIATESLTHPALRYGWAKQVALCASDLGADLLTKQVLSIFREGSPMRLANAGPALALARKVPGFDAQWVTLLRDEEGTLGGMSAAEQAQVMLKADIDLADAWTHVGEKLLKDAAALTTPQQAQEWQYSWNVALEKTDAAGLRALHAAMSRNGFDSGRGGEPAPHVAAARAALAAKIEKFRKP